MYWRSERERQPRGGINTNLGSKSQTRQTLTQVCSEWWKVKHHLRMDRQSSAITIERKKRRLGKLDILRTRLLSQRWQNQIQRTWAISRLPLEPQQRQASRVLSPRRNQARSPRWLQKRGRNEAWVYPISNNVNARAQAILDGNRTNCVLPAPRVPWQRSSTC